MVKNEFDPFLRYLDVCADGLKNAFEKQNDILDEKIESTFLNILLNLADISTFDVSSDLVSGMFTLANLITERFCEGKKFEPTDEMITLLSRELRMKIKNSDKKVNLVLGTGDTIKNVTLMLDNEAVLSIETFDDDRFKNDLMVSCNRVRNTRQVTSARVVSPNYVFGDNGVYINAGDESFLDVFGKNDTEDFDSKLNLKYYYIDYSTPEESLLVDRSKGIKTTINASEKDFVSPFCIPMLNGIILGALKHSDEQILNFINKPSTTSEDDAKVYKKVNE